jgi:hypothetical protein
MGKKKENVKFTTFLVKFTPCPPQSGPGYASCSSSRGLGRGQETRQGVNLTKKGVNLKFSKKKLFIYVGKFLIVLVGVVMWKKSAPMGVSGCLKGSFCTYVRDMFCIVSMGSNSICRA